MTGKTDTLAIEITDAPAEEDATRVVGGLVAFNNATVGPSNRRTLAALLRTEAGGAVSGGAIGYTAWDWFYVEKVWVDEALRGQGAAGRLLDAAEAEARRRGCKGAWLDTLNPAARAVYERQGYTVCGEISDFTAGRSRIFLQKRFD
jgi:GNAT superfamily N-acetyltransferase